MCSPENRESLVNSARRMNPDRTRGESENPLTRICGIGEKYSLEFQKTKSPPYSVFYSVFYCVFYSIFYFVFYATFYAATLNTRRIG